MNYHNIFKNWGWLGGHADMMDNLLDVAKKEIYEESGLKNIKPLFNNIISLEALPVISHIKNGKVISSHIHLNVTYLFMANENDKLVINKNEGSGLKWVKIDDAPKITNEEQMKPIYVKLNKRIEEYKKIMGKI
jgi:8-oxo-dGTP pyrophosphatase MutT (NUDIX family)